MTYLRQGIDYVMNEEGLMVLTRAYLEKRGYCCQSGCINCPWDYREKKNPNIPSELADSDEGEIPFEDGQEPEDD